MKKILILMTLTTLVLLTSCAKLINTEYKEVEVKITDTYYRAPYTTPIRVGKTTTYVHHPSAYYVYVEYEGIEYTLGGIGIYNEYKSKVGQIVQGKLEINTYDNDTIKYDILEIWEK